MRIITRMNVGGPARQLTALMRGLDTARFDQRLYVGRVAPDEADYLRHNGNDLAVHTLGGLGRAVHPGDDVRALSELALAIRRFRPHVVHTHTTKAGALGRAAAKLARVPVCVHTFHGHLLHSHFPPAKTRLLVQTERTLARITERLVAVGARVRDDLVAAGIGTAHQYSVIPPGTTLGPLPDRSEARALLGIPADVPLVVFVGRVTKIKRPDRFLAAARRIRPVLPLARFAVCGDGDLSAVWQSATDLADGLHLLGWRSDVETVYAAADLVMLTSDNEGMPVSLIEAGLAGVPVVATDVGSVGEVVRDGETGLLARQSADELAQHVARLLTDEPLRLRMGQRAREWTTGRFGTERLVADTQELYGSIAVAHGWWPRPYGNRRTASRMEIQPRK